MKSETREESVQVSSRLVKDQSKVIFRKEGVSRIGSARVVENLVLFRVVQDGSRSLTENLSSLTHDRFEERFDRSEDESVDRVRDLLHD